MTNENFFKHDDKAYAENLNDAILIANAFDYQVPVNIPGMYGNNHYPNDNNIHKVGVADVTIVSSGSLSIGDTSITNNSNTSQVLRLRVYPNFNNFYGWKDLGWDGDDGITIDICDAGTTTSLLPSGELTNPDGNNLAGIASLRGLKEYDLLITIPTNCSLNSLSLVFVNNLNSQNRVSASINQSNVTGLVSDLSGIHDDLSSLESGKANTVHTHSSMDVIERNTLPNIGIQDTATQSRINLGVNAVVGSLSDSITNLIKVQYANLNFGSINSGVTGTQTATVTACPEGYSTMIVPKFTSWCVVNISSVSGTTLSVSVLNNSSGSHTCSAGVYVIYYPSSWDL